MGNGACSGDCIPDSYQPRLSDANQSNVLNEVHKEDSFYKIDHPYTNEYRSGGQGRESLPFDDMRPSAVSANQGGVPGHGLNLSISSIKPIRELTDQTPLGPTTSHNTLRPPERHYGHNLPVNPYTRTQEVGNQQYYQVPELGNKGSGFGKQHRPQQEDARASKENRLYFEPSLFDLPDKHRGNANYQPYSNH